MIFKYVLPKYVHSNGLKLRGALEEFFYHFTLFGFKNANIQPFEEIKRFESSFIDLKFM